MQKFVHSYLSASFVIGRTETNKTGKLTVFGFDAIFPKSNGESEKSFIYGNKLIKELVLAAYIDEVRLRKYINEWVRINYPEADLKLYWLQLEPELPSFDRVIAQTVALDLLEVKPMSGPTGKLVYLDYQYTGNTNEPNRNGRVYKQEIFNENIAQLIRNQVALLQGELDHETKPIFVSSRKSEEIERQSWFNPKKDLDNPE
jgi:hypothetical protein